VTTASGGSASDTKVMAAFNVFLSLTPSQQQHFRMLVGEYDDSNLYGKQEIRTKVARVSLGPLGTACPFCGK
jgi:hypothetical protein